jgi:hypothetical protein
MGVSEVLAHTDTAQVAGVPLSYRLDVWNMNGVSDEVRVTGCLPEKGFTLGEARPDTVGMLRSVTCEATDTDVLAVRDRLQAD